MAFPDPFTWRGRVGRAYYVGIGFTLMAVKHNADRLIASFYGYDWTVFNYWVFPSATLREVFFYGTLLAFLLPFVWVGTCLTIQRLRDLKWPLGMVLLFFVPVLNLFFFLILAAIPSGRRFMPSGQLASAFLGVVSTALLAVVVVTLSAAGIGNYGWGAFVGIPFFLGLNSVLIFGFHEERPLGKCLVVAILSTCLAELSLFAFAIEVLFWLIMALPLALVLSLVGALCAYTGLPVATNPEIVYSPPNGSHRNRWWRHRWTHHGNRTSAFWL